MAHLMRLRSDESLELQIWDVCQAWVTIVSYKRMWKAIVASDSAKQIRTYFVAGDTLYW